MENDFKVIEDFVRRLKKIGVDVTLVGNYPWVYLDTVNEKKVEGTFQADHGFTAFWYGVKRGSKAHFTDIREVFKKIRETLQK